MAFIRLALLMTVHAAYGLQIPPHQPPADTPGNAQKMPWRGNVAVIVRGQPFRGWRDDGSCMSECRESQLNASRSIVSRLIEPLEQTRKNSVDIFNVDCGDEPCKLLADENMALSSNNTRSVRSTFVNSNVEGGQAICVQRALDFFQTSVDPSKYDTIIVIRHDVEWLESIFSWSGANFKGFNFFSRCEAGAFMNENDGLDGPSACVNDIMQVIPGRKFEAWRAEVGKGKCFNTEWRKGHGHMCWKQAVLAAGGDENVHLATPWIPKGWVREESTFARLKQCNNAPPEKDLHPEKFNEIGAYK
eukprot:TRINITY_DN695_c0_g2_i1.p1 TRINITY_DN695_c0_g2~~TRINITY_DN695_c0_g2_i1.p1  ORF type:complete len:344 (-),score=50.17 TRINITY_DN695_c0_g2_i1:110-1018(-)